MGSNLFVIGLSWRTAPVEVREKLAFSDGELPAELAKLTGSGSIAEAMVMSTCNRVEIYGATPRSLPSSALDRAVAQVRGFLSQSRGVPAEMLAESLYEYTDTDAVRHAFRVAAALDSLVVGETQVLGQLKAAYGTAVTAGASGPLLGRCMERAFGVAKRVRNETGISRGAANVSSVAVELAKRVFVDLGGKTVLIVGAGKMSALAARHLHADGAGSILVTNRSPERAEELAAEIDGVARPWDQLETLLALADVVISSTGSREPVLTKPLLKRVMRQRRYRSMVIIDIAVPRDAEPELAKIDGVYLFDIDDLRRVVEANIKERAKEADAASRIIDDEVEEFERWLLSQRVVPTIRSLREHFQQVAQAEVERTLKQLGNETTSEQRDEAIRRLGNIIVNKLLHAPMTALKTGDEREIDILVAATNRLFPLERAGEEESSPDREAATSANAPLREGQSGRRSV